MENMKIYFKKNFIYLWKSTIKRKIGCFYTISAVKSLVFAWPNYRHPNFHHFPADEDLACYA